MRQRFAPTALAVAVLAASAWTQGRGIAYAVDEEDTDHLFAVDLTSGNATDLGPVGFDGVEALAFHPDGRLFGIDEVTQQLVQIDLRNGAGTAIAALSAPVEDPGFAIDALGRAWVSSEGGKNPQTVHALDLATGAMTLLLEAAADLHGLCAIGATLYATGSDVPSLFRIDTKKKQVVEIGPLVAAVGTQPSLDSASDGTLWMLDDEGGLFRLNRFTGEATPAGTTIIACDAMAIPLRQVCAYSVDSDNTDNLFQLDLLTGAAIRIGPTGSTSIEGLAFHPDGRLFGVDDSAQALVTIDLRTGTATNVGALGLNASNPGLAIDANGEGWIANDNPGSFFSVNLQTGAASNIGAQGREITGLAAIGTSLFGLGDDSPAPATELMSVNPGTGVATLIGPYANISHTCGGLDSTPDGALWGLDDDGEIVLVSPATGEAIFIAQTVAGCEGLAIPPACGPDEAVVHATAASFDLDWTVIDGGDPSNGSFELDAQLPRAKLPSSLEGAELTVSVNGVDLGGTHVLDASGRFRSASGAAPAIDASVSAQKGTLSFSIEGLDIAGVLDIENATVAGAILAAVRVRLLSGTTVLVDARNLLPIAFTSEQNQDASGSFALKSSPSYLGAAVATKVSAKQGDGDSFDVSFQGTLLPNGAGFLVASDAALEGVEPVMILRVGAAAPIEIPIAALAISGEGSKTKWKLSGNVTGLKSLSYSAAKGKLSFAIDDVAGTGIPLIVLDLEGPILEHVLPVEVIVATAGLPQSSGMSHRLVRTSGTSGSWK